MSPLDQLAISLILGEPPAFDWVVEFSDQDAFCAAWDAEDRPETLVELYSYVDERRAVLALCLVAEAVLPQLATARGEDEALRLIRVAKRWCDGKATVAETLAAVANSNPPPKGEGDAFRAAMLAAHAPRVVELIKEGELDSHAGIGYGATVAVRAWTGRDTGEHSTEIADVVRRLLPCPSAMALIARVVG